MHMERHCMDQPFQSNESMPTIQSSIKPNFLFLLKKTLLSLPKLLALQSNCLILKFKFCRQRLFNLFGRIGQIGKMNPIQFPIVQQRSPRAVEIVNRAQSLAVNDTFLIHSSLLPFFSLLSSVSSIPKSYNVSILVAGCQLHTCWFELSKSS